MCKLSILILTSLMKTKRSLLICLLGLLRLNRNEGATAAGLKNELIRGGEGQIRAW